MNQRVNALGHMFDLRKEFMKALKEKVPTSYPEWPVDVSQRESQQVLRETTLRGVEELFEALQHLKNWKTHRSDTDEDFDREAFLEEMVDALNYFFAVLVMLGINDEELFYTYRKKHNIIMNRIENNSKS